MFLQYPIQKLPQSKKTLDWYKQNIDFAANIRHANESIRDRYYNVLENQALRLNIIDVEKYRHMINPWNIDEERFPVQFKHIGIGNSKIAVLIGDYINRRVDIRAYISNNDEHSNSEKEEGLKAEMLQNMIDLFKQSLSEEEMKNKMQKLTEWMSYDYQDIREITANKILQKESAEQDFDRIFTETWGDLLYTGKQYVWIEEFAGKPVIKRIDPSTVYTYGGDGVYAHDRDLIIVEEYKSIGQIYDQYYDELSKADRKKLEERNAASWNKTGISGGLFGSTTNVNEFVDAFDSNNNFVKILDPNEALFTSGPDYDRNGNWRVTTVFWKSRRKVYKLSYPDSFGEIQTTWVGEGYIPDESIGEEVEEIWINEWNRGTRLGHDIYVKMGVVKGSSKSLTNISSGLPPIIGIELPMGLYDLIKPLDIAYDITFWRQQLLINTTKPNATAVNQSMIPSGWTTEEWLAITAIDNIMYLDPHQEVLTGPNQGQASGKYNSFVTETVELGNQQNKVEMLRMHCENLNYLMGKRCGVPDTREGEVGDRAAVRNIQTQLQQFTKSTEEWFQVDAIFKKAALKKFLDVAKLAYKNNPQLGAYILDEVGMEMIKYYSEFSETEFDIFITNGYQNNQVFENITRDAEAALAAGLIGIQDMLEIRTTKSTQKLKGILNRSIELKQQREMEALNKQLEAENMKMQAEMRERQADRDLKYYEIDANYNAAIYKADATVESTLINAEAKDRDSDRRHLNLTIDNMTPEEEALKRDQLALEKEKLREIIRHNKVMEKQGDKKIAVQKMQKKTPTRKSS
ncbi:MAG TPA: hypothetical protein VIK77_00280 [Tissierellaceae bacterium]